MLLNWVVSARRTIITSIHHCISFQETFFFSFCVTTILSTSHHNLWLSRTRLWEQWRHKDVIQSSFISTSSAVSPPLYLYIDRFSGCMTVICHAGCQKNSYFYVCSPQVLKVLKITRKLDPLEDCKLFFYSFYFLIRMNQYAEIQFYT